MAPRILCLIFPGFEEIEAIAPVDLLRRAGAEVVLASLSDDRTVDGRCGIAIQTDSRLADLDPDTFRVLLIPGGPGVKGLRTDGRAARLARAFVDSGRDVAALCAAPTVLADAQLLEGRRFTAHSSVYGELPAALPNERVVEDGPIVTSRGAGTAIDFGLALVRRLFGAARADEIARAIMA